MQVLVLLYQAQDGPEALGQAEGVFPTALLPGPDGQQLQGIGGGIALLLSCGRTWQRTGQGPQGMKGWGELVLLEFCCISQSPGWRPAG